jgi:UDP-galactopyranose mutase
MPRHGFAALFERMIDHPKIALLLNADYREVRKHVLPRHATLYTGPVDEYFDGRLGSLPYRSLSFDFVEYPTEYRQPCVQINYPNDFTYTRSVETKHLTGQKHPATVITYETPRGTGEPYYPVPVPQNTRLYQQYLELASAETRLRRVYFCGRLAQYRYFNTDEVITEALKCFEAMREACAEPRGDAQALPLAA